MSKIYKLKSVKTDHFDRKEISSKKTKSKIEMAVNLSIGISGPDKNIVMFSPEINFLDNGDKFIDLAINSFFEIKKSHWNKFLSEDKKSLTLPLDLAVELNDISLGIIRGYLIAKTESKETFIFPCVNSRDLIKENPVIHFK